MFLPVLQLQSWVQLALGVAAFAFTLFALVDAVRQRPDAYTAAGKQTKNLWLLLLGIAAAVGFVSVYNPLNMFDLIAVVVAGVYMADVRPAVRGMTGGSGRSGPYGPW